MAISRDENLNFIIDKYQSAWNQKLYGATDRTTAYNCYLVGDDHAAIYWLCEFGLHVLNSLQDLIWDWWPYEGTCPVPYFLKYHTIAEAGDVDMDAIIYAMLAAEEDEVEYFIGLVDAYRVSLWNKPFFAEFYAALARGFTIWP